MDQSFDTEFPLSINDVDLDPDATEPPTPRPGVSEMTFCLIRYEICSLTRKLSYTPPGAHCQERASKVTLEDKERMIKECSDRLEEKYLQYCEDAGPLYWVAATVARLITAKMSLIIYHPLTQPGQFLSQDTKDRLFMASIEIMEYSRVLESEASTKKWGWLFHTYIQWHAIAYILGELSIRPHSMIVDRAWRAIDPVFNDWGSTLPHSKTKTGMLWQPMRKLMAKARRKREENMQAQIRQGHISSDLGINSEYIRPPPSGPGSKPIGPPSIPRDRIFRKTTDVTNLITNQDKNQTQSSNQTQNGTSLCPLNSESPAGSFPQTFMTNPGDIPMTEPQIPSQVIGMGPMLAPEQIQLQLQQQQMQQAPWLMDNNAFADLDMAGLDGDPSWEGWDDLVRDFQMEVDNQGGLGEIRGPTLGGMGTWW
jgi:hypothetical protein